MSSPDVGDLEREYVEGALRGGWVAPLGPEVDAFEAEIAARTNRAFAVALSSGTAALHLGLLAMGVGPDDTVVTSSMTFAATANAITYTGAKPYFVDCNETGNMDPILLAEALVKLTSEGRHIAAVIPVDLLGKVADYPSILELTNQYGIPVFSDAAESFGASLDGFPAGSFGESAILSFNGNKVMTTSGGGMFLTDNEELANKVRYLATQARQPVAHYEHVDIGYNYRMSNILAALGRAQLSRLDEMIRRRREMRSIYKTLFNNVPGITVFQSQVDDHDEKEDNCWLTAILVNEGKAGFTPADLTAALAELNIETRPLWKPMHLQPVFKDIPSLTNGISDRLFSTGLTLPSGSALTRKQRALVVDALTSFVTSAHG